MNRQNRNQVHSPQRQRALARGAKKREAQFIKKFFSPDVQKSNWFSHVWDDLRELGLRWRITPVRALFGFTSAVLTLAQNIGFLLEISSSSASQSKSSFFSNIEPFPLAVAFYVLACVALGVTVSFIATFLTRSEIAVSRSAALIISGLGGILLATYTQWILSHYAEDRVTLTFFFTLVGISLSVYAAKAIFVTTYESLEEVNAMRAFALAIFALSASVVIAFQFFFVESVGGFF